MKQTYQTRIYNLKQRRLMIQRDLPTDHKNS